MNQETIKQGVTKEMTMGEIVKKYPEAIEIMLSHGLHCVGCGASYAETLEEGVLSHGGSEEEIEELVAKINEAISQTDPNKLLNITAKAAEKLKELFAKEGKANAGLRIQVMPGGCAGYQYGLAIEEKPQPNDEVIQDAGVQVFVEKESMKLLKGAKIDYIDSLQGAGFRISNPNAQSTCGCGNSFT